MRSATNANAVVSNLFPESMQKRILQDAEEKIEQKTKLGGKSQQLTSFLEDGKGTTLSASKPIADLFPEATIMYADVSGFTAWSSAREPSQVFTLLETIYSEFDVCARKRKVFKIETIGDCYVAAAGLPEPRENHAVVMARFATDCVRAMDRLSKQLDVLLGPDTSNLNIRIGLNSGPVTAG
jgi:class 3 adenylate cyclase